jgi:hypothetical protein
MLMLMLMLMLMYFNLKNKVTAALRPQQPRQQQQKQCRQRSQRVYSGNAPARLISQWAAAPLPSEKSCRVAR